MDIISSDAHFLNYETVLFCTKSRAKVNSSVYSRVNSARTNGNSVSANDQAFIIRLPEKKSFRDLSSIQYFKKPEIYIKILITLC